MSGQFPFGFGSGAGGSGGSGGSGSGPGGFGFGEGAPFFRELERLLSWQGGPINWELARQMAVQGATSESRPASERQQREVRESGRLAGHWLDEVTTLPGLSGAAEELASWSRTEWVERTLPVWQSICDPVAGSALAALAGEVVGATDIGLPLGPPALLPANVEALGEGLEQPADQVQLFVAVRELAHQRLFSHVPWLRSHLLGAVEEYARGITVDPDVVGRAVSQIDPTQFDPSSMDQDRLAELLGADAFTGEQSPEQTAALARLETALALVEGWVDEVTMAAVNGRLPAAVSLQEAIRRRRATGGPAEQTFAALVGLELRPRRLRDASALWKAMRDKRGIDGRDAIWAHPDLLPTSDDLDDPVAFVAGGEAMDPMAEIAKLASDPPKERSADKRIKDGEREADKPEEPGTAT